MAAPAVHRSQSSPDLFLNAPSLTDPPPNPSAPIALSRLVTAPQNREATSKDAALSPVAVPSFDFGAGVETNLPIESELSELSEAEATTATTTTAEPVVARPKLPPEPMPVPPIPPTKRRSRSIVGRPKSWLASKSASASSEAPEPKEKAAALKKDKKAPAENVEKDAGKNEEAPSRRRLTARDRSSSFRSSSFKSWISSSRSPSPTRDREKREAPTAEKGAEGEDAQVKDSSRLSPHKLTRRRAPSTSPGTGENKKAEPAEQPSGTSRALNRASGYFGKIKQQKPPRVPPAKAATNLDVPPLPGSSTKSEAVSPAASTRSVSDNFNPRLSSQTNLSATSDAGSGGTGSTGITEPSQNAENMSSQKPQPQRDPLWATFRRLDSEYAIFLTKTTTAHRILIARNTLIPFLRGHGGQSSGLSAEDIDRRATILHKWWNGLLGLLEGMGSKTDLGPAKTFAAIHANTTTVGLAPVSGVDRPGLLELITYIMMRPEWRMCTPCFRPLKDRTATEAGHDRAEARESTDCIIESAEHNVRTMFVNNLLTQMAIVVDRMSGRHAPSSLVTFCGKACAYAFFFVPGIAEVLARLWGLTPDLLRRVADEFGLPRRSKGESEEIVSLFPPNLQKLGWTSVKTMTDNLRLTTKLSLVAANIQWHGPWISRWRGGDSDLFFIFCKYYFILADDFMPTDLPLSEKARAPGFALIHAQLLSVLDTTIHRRQAAFESMMAPNILDPANGADAMAAALAQLPPSNLLRGMDENRLVVLLKDMLAGNAVGGLTAGARETFAMGFMSILKAATKKTPLFRQAPVLILMDFFHEVLLALDAYAGYTGPGHKDGQLRDHVDWPFWLDVCHKILFESNSTMSEIRVLSFIFSAWDILTADAARKEKLCIGWLLSEEVFDKFFNNYTPMVRAYYMRLLCWRICRDLGSPNELDMKIFNTVADRLKQAWSHYLWLKQAADAAGKLPPSTAPCHPQPGKRFMIVRMEVPPPQTGLLQTGFDIMNSAVGGHEISAPEPGQSESSGDAPTAQADSASKKRWSIFGKMLSFTSSAAPAGPAATEAARRNNTSTNDLEAVRRETAAERSRPPPPPKGSSSSGESDASSTGSAPVYDAAQFVFKFTLGVLPWNPNVDIINAASTMLSTLPRERPLTRPRLPAPAQARISARAASSGSHDDSPPPPSPGMPPPERMYSGSSQGGLISGARNATPLTDEKDEAGHAAQKNDFSGFNFNLPEIQHVKSIESIDVTVKTPVLDNDPVFKGSERPEPPRGRTEADRQVVQPIQPVGIYKDRATYSGRALAEWSIVVHECNSFIDRRRDEGVCGLKEVEVPSLGVENLRRMG